MDVITVLLLIVILINLMLVLVSSTCPKEKLDSVYISYLFNITTITWWVSSMVLFRFDTSDFVVKNLYISATCIASSLYYFSLVFPHKEKSFKKDLFTVGLINLLLVGLILGTNLIVHTSQEGTVQFGSGYFIYIAYTLILFVISFWRLFLRYVKIKMEAERFQSLSFFFGYSISGIVGITTNLFLPWVGVPQYQYLGPLSTICVVISISYAVKRFRLFNIQTAATEFFVLILWIFTILRVCLVDENTPASINLIYIILVIVVGILAVRSVKKEHIQYLNNIKLVRELEVLNERLSQVDTQKTKFVSLAAHHIASPLTSIKAYLSLLRGEYAGTFSGDDLKTVEHVMEELVCILKDFLDISRIEIGGIQINNSSENIVLMVNTVIGKLEDRFRLKNLRIIKKFNPEMEVRGVFDYNKICTAIENIFENSILYSRDSNIEVQISDGEECFEVKICDFGIRRFPHIQQSLVEKFSSTHNQDEADIIGRGLGLYVTKKIIEAHKGQFCVEKEGEKTVFTCSVPKDAKLQKEV